MKIDVNDFVFIRITPKGRELYDDNGRHPEDADGWSTWQLWEVMQAFGPFLYKGAPPPFETRMRIEPAKWSFTRIFADTSAKLHFVRNQIKEGRIVLLR